MNEVYIVGAGIHPFGRHKDKTGLEQGIHAARLALADAGIDWSDIQFAFGGSDSAGNADAVLPHLGLTGIQFINVKNDRLDWDGMVSMFTADCIVSYVEDEPAMAGRDALYEILSTYLPNTVSSIHYLSNSQVLFDSDDVATISTYMYSWQRYKPYPVMADCHRWAVRDSHANARRVALHLYAAAVAR
jgi:hypothetical protein